MLFVYFCVPILLLSVIVHAKGIVLKITSHLGSYRPPYAVFFIVRLMLFIVFLYSVKSCGKAYLEKLFEMPADQAFNSELWKKNENVGTVRHTMLKSLEQNHTFLLRKSQTQVIELLGAPDTLYNHNSNTDFTLYYRANHPTMIMGGDEYITVHFRKNSSYKIVFSYRPSKE